MILPDSLLRLPIAHRALHDLDAGRVENSLGAIRAAVAAGYGIELDLQMSRDGVPMVFHDVTLDRLTTMSGPVLDYAASALRGVPFRTGSETIPTFEEVLDLVAGQVPLLVEIKDQSLDLTETDGRLERATAALLAQYSGDVAVMSFNPHAVAHMAEAAPNIPRGLTTGTFEERHFDAAPARLAELRPIPDFERVGACFISHQGNDLASAAPYQLRAEGHPVLCWTIRGKMQEAAVRPLADNITFEGYLPEIPVA